MNRSEHDKMMIRRAGSTGLLVWTRRVWRWKALVTIQLLSSVPLIGIVGYYDEDEAKWCVGLGLGFTRIDIEPVRCLDNAEYEVALDNYVATYGSDVVADAESFLRRSE